MHISAEMLKLGGEMMCFDWRIWPRLYGEEEKVPEDWVNKL